ncbi:MAG: hypothetical protein Q9224_001098 [Gallowayella concinna]
MKTRDGEPPKKKSCPVVKLDPNEGKSYCDVDGQSAAKPNRRPSKASSSGAPKSTASSKKPVPVPLPIIPAKTMASSSSTSKATSATTSKASSSTKTSKPSSSTTTSRSSSSTTTSKSSSSSQPFLAPPAEVPESPQESGAPTGSDDGDSPPPSPPLGGSKIPGWLLSLWSRLRWPRKGKSPPQPPANLFVMGYFHQCGKRDKTVGLFGPGTECYSEGAVFKNDESNDPCNNRPVFRSVHVEGVPRDPGFPEKLMFEGAGRKNCEFDRSEDESPGTLFCDGARADCYKEEAPTEVKCKLETFVKQVHCLFPQPGAGPAPPPPPPARAIAVGYFQACMEENCDSAAGILVAPDHDDEDQHFACIDKPLYRDTKMSPPERPIYPQQIKFEGGGRKDCEFKRAGDDDEGWMRCGHDEAFKCAKKKIVEHDCKDYNRNEIWRTQLICEFDTFDGKQVPSVLKRTLEATSTAPPSPSPSPSSSSSHLPSTTRPSDPPPVPVSALIPRSKATPTIPSTIIHGKVYAIGYFQSCLHNRADNGPCRSQAAVFIPEADNHLHCKKTPLYRDAANEFKRPRFPQRLEFQGEDNMHCVYERKDAKASGSLNCAGSPVKCATTSDTAQPLLHTIDSSPKKAPPRHPFTAAKLDPRDTPPPLHFSPVTSEQERSSTADTTPIGTPKTFDNTFRRRSDKERERDLISSYYRKTSGFAGNTSSYVDSALLESDSEDFTFPLFQDTAADDNMDTRNNVHGAFLPRPSRTSNLTSALQSTSGNESRPTPAMNISNGKGPNGGFAHRDSLSGGLATSGSHYDSGAHSTSMSSAIRERPRRESLAGSMVSGMSWGGMSVGSWVRDE